MQPLSTSLYSVAGTHGQMAFATAEGMWVCLQLHRGTVHLRTNILFSSSAATVERAAFIRCTAKYRHDHRNTMRRRGEAITLTMSPQDAAHASTR